MSTINNGGPAFPIPLNDGQSWVGMNEFDGMTLRDYFAAKAMQGMLANQHCFQASDEQMFARDSYVLADAMLKAREGGAT